MKFLTTIAHFFSQINELVGKNVSWITTLLMLLICFDVAMRYLFNNTAVWIIELEWHLFALIFLLGAGYTLKHDKHVRVDLFYAKFSKKRKALVNFIGTLIFLIPWCIIVLLSSFKYAKTAFQIGESSPDPGGLPARYIIKFAITLGVFLLFLQALALLFNSLKKLLERETGTKQPSTNH